MWTLEAHIDGENSGSHTFQVIAAEKPEGAAPQRHLLQTSEIYQKALSSMVLIEALSANGQRIGSGLGFTLEEGTIVTAFQVIDGAAQLRIVLPSGQQGTTDQVVAWNRLQDWALLKADTGSLSKLPRATEELAVGDRCFSFEMAAGEARTIVEQQITGKSVHAEMGARLNLLQFASPAAMGSPVLNEYGEVVAILGGNTYPGLHRGSQGADAAIVPGLYRGAMATPIAMVTPLPSSAVKSLAELAAAGQFVPPVQPRPELVYGMIGAHFEHGKSAFQASRQSKTDLSRAADRVCSVALEWNSRAKIKTQVLVALYDLENHLLAKSAPVKVNLGGGQYATTFVDFPLSALKPGYYRAEAQQENVPIWRAYFKVSE